MKIQKTDRNWFEQIILLDHLDRKVGRAEKVADPAEKFLALLDARSVLREAEEATPVIDYRKFAIAGVLRAQAVSLPVIISAALLRRDFGLAAAALSVLGIAGGGFLSGVWGSTKAAEKSYAQNRAMKDELALQKDRIDGDLRQLSFDHARQIGFSDRIEAIVGHRQFYQGREANLASSFFKATSLSLRTVAGMPAPMRQAQSHVTAPGR